MRDGPVEAPEKEFFACRSSDAEDFMAPVIIYTTLVERNYIHGVQTQQ
jgi:hypothetical protein